MKNQTKRVMKLTFITLFLSTTGMFASVNSQNTRVNIHVNNANTQIVLNEIEKQTDYLFVYDTKEIDLNRKMCYHLSLPKQTSHMRWRVITSC